MILLINPKVEETKDFNLSMKIALESMSTFIPTFFLSHKESGKEQCLTLTFMVQNFQDMLVHTISL